MQYHVYIYGEVGVEATASKFQESLKNLGDATELVVHISSAGGSVYQGWTIGNTIKTLGIKSRAVIEGYCGSIATFIALSCNQVDAIDPSHFMIHNPAIGMDGEAKDLRYAANVLDQIKQDLINIYKRKTNLADNVLSDMMDKTTSLSVDEAIKYGFIDKKIEAMRAVAYFDIKPINNKKMDNTKVTGILNKIEGFLNKLVGQVDAKNLVVELADGKKVFVQTEDGEIEGKPAFLADSEGNPTETVAPNGNHALIDGRVITVENGIVTAVAEAAEDAAPAAEMDEEKEAMKAKIAEMEAQLAAKASVETEMTNKLKEFETTIPEMVNAINELKQMTVGKPYVAPKGATVITNKNTKSEPVANDELGDWGRAILKKQGII